VVVAVTVTEWLLLLLTLLLSIVALLTSDALPNSNNVDDDSFSSCVFDNFFALSFALQKTENENYRPTELNKFFSYLM
jgi:hypothetical protein